MVSRFGLLRSVARLSHPGVAEWSAGQLSDWLRLQPDLTRAFTAIHLSMQSGSPLPSPPIVSYFACTWCFPASAAQTLSTSSFSAETNLAGAGRDLRIRNDQPLGAVTVVACLEKFTSWRLAMKVPAFAGFDC